MRPLDAHLKRYIVGDIVSLVFTITEPPRTGFALRFRELAGAGAGNRAARKYRLRVPGDARFQVETRVGKLVEARVFSLPDAAAADAYGEAVAEAARRLGGSPVLCADHRAVRVYPQSAADRLVELFKPNNKRFARLTLLIAPTNAVLLLQLERLIREAGSNQRRVFKEPDDALKHLGDVLDQAELARAKAFLAELPQPL